MGFGQDAAQKPANRSVKTALSLSDGGSVMLLMINPQSLDLRIARGVLFSPYYRHPQHFGMESHCTFERSRGTHGRGPCVGSGNGTLSEGKFFASTGFVFPGSVTMARDCAF